MASTRITFLFSLFALLVCAIAIHAQVATETDDAGDTIIVSVSTDDAGDLITSTISIIAAGGAVIATPTTSRCVGSTCPPSPTIYTAYSTDPAGDRVPYNATFVASFAVTSSPAPVSSGTILQASSVFASLSSAASVAVGTNTVPPSANGAVPKMSMMMSGVGLGSVLVALVGVAVGMVVVF